MAVRKTCWVIGATRYATLAAAKRAAVKSSSAHSQMDHDGHFVIKKRDARRGITPHALDERVCRLTKTKTGKTRVVCQGDKPKRKRKKA